MLRLLRQHTLAFPVALISHKCEKTEMMRVRMRMEKMMMRRMGMMEMRMMLAMMETAQPLFAGEPILSGRPNCCSQHRAAVFKAE